MSYEKDMDAINGFMATAEFREDVRQVAHKGGTDAVVSDGGKDFVVIVRCAKEDLNIVSRRLSSIKRAKVNKITDTMLGINIQGGV
jgi:hypothetical protein